MIAGALLEALRCCFIWLVSGVWVCKNSKMILGACKWLLVALRPFLSASAISKERLDGKIG